MEALVLASQGGDFWAKHGEAFCSAYIALAGLSHLVPREDGRPRKPLSADMLALWAHMQVGILDPTVNELIRAGLAREQPLEVRLLARHAMTHLMALHREDPRIRGSIFATARLAFEAWLEPAVAHSASTDARWRYDSAPEERWESKPRWIDLAWLMGDKDDGCGNTLYICAPETEFARLTPVIGGLLGDLREQVHSWDVSGKRLEKPLLIVIDEAGQLELQWLPAAVSTLAGLGVALVTCWQSRAQISDRYGSLSDAVVSGHRSKVFFSGLDDPASVDYVTKVAGSERVTHRTWSADARGSWRTISEHSEPEQLLPARLVRQIPGQEAVLFHGTLPPIHLRAVRWWEDEDLRRLVPTDGEGRPMPPGDLPTCPLTDEPPDESVPDDGATVSDVVARLPSPRTNSPADPPGASAPTADHTTAGAADQARSSGSATTSSRATRTASRRASSGRSSTSQQQQLPLATAHVQEPSDPARRRPNRIAGVCDRCQVWVEVEAGETVQLGRRAVLRCYPACAINWDQIDTRGPARGSAARR